MSLLQSYGLLQKMARIEPAEASFDELASFHSQDYLDFCDQLSKTSDQEKYTTSLNEKLKTNSTSIEDEYGVEFDCPVLPNLSKLISWLAGGSLCKLYLGPSYYTTHGPPSPKVCALTVYTPTFR